MAIDLKKAEEIGGLRYTIVREWSREGHDVALMIIENPKFPDLDRSPSPMCQCDFEVEERVGEDGRKYHVHTGDGHRCPHKAAFRELVIEECRAKYGAAWRDMGVKEAILDIHERVKAGEYLGTSWGGVVYLQEVGELLGIPPPWDVCAELFEEERLQLHGAILADYAQRFRFPRELAGFMRYIIEAPLGWPNGEAGDGFVATLEGIIEENGEVKHGRDLFGQDFPYIRPKNLLIMGLAALRASVTRAETSRRSRKALYFSDLDGYGRHIAAGADHLRPLWDGAAWTKNADYDKWKDLADRILKVTEVPDRNFNFPAEVHVFLAHLMAGGNPQRLEDLISEFGRWEKKDEAFWEHNYPHVAESETIMFGLNWLMAAVEAAQTDPEIRDRLGRDMISCAIKECDELAERFRQLHKRMWIWQRLARLMNSLSWKLYAWRHNLKARLGLTGVWGKVKIMRSKDLPDDEA
ncbi:hypothetical protein AMJ57_04275 [Parcubacteria bacterium SG8_24]|nr:MAG: hypothetical protein AMJ57_04275 [Parcubacteria bacterium SG8_24]